MPSEGINAKLLELQRRSIKVQKDSINPHYGNSYVSLHALMDRVLPELTELGLVLTQTPTIIEWGGPGLKTRLTDVETGEYTEDAMSLALDRGTPQGQGSAITYARRYALMSLLGLVADEDDDGEKATAEAASQLDAPAYF